MIDNMTMFKGLADHVCGPWPVMLWNHNPQEADTRYRMNGPRYCMNGLGVQGVLQNAPS